MNLNASLKFSKYLVSATLNLIVLAIRQFYKTYKRLLYGEHYVQMKILLHQTCDHFLLSLMYHWFNPFRDNVINMVYTIISITTRQMLTASRGEPETAYNNILDY